MKPGGASCVRASEFATDIPTIGFEYCWTGGGAGACVMATELLGGKQWGGRPSC